MHEEECTHTLFHAWLAYLLLSVCVRACVHVGGCIVKRREKEAGVGGGRDSFPPLTLKQECHKQPG